MTAQACVDDTIEWISNEGNKEHTHSPSLCKSNFWEEHCYNMTQRSWSSVGIKLLLLGMMVNQFANTDAPRTLAPNSETDYEQSQQKVLSSIICTH